MSKITGLTPKKASLFVRFAYWMTKRKFGKVIEPVKILGHHPRLLRAISNMEMGIEAANSVPASLKSIVELKTAQMIGCPF